LVIIDTSLSKIGLRDFVSTLPVAPKKSFSLLPGEFDMEKVIDLATQAAEKIGAKRLVIDSLPALDVFVGDKVNIRRTLVNVNYKIKNSELTSLLVTEMTEDDGVSRYQVEEYVADGVLVLKANEALDTTTMRIRKMRTTKHSLKPHTMMFSERGIEIKEPAKASIL